jgi:hypothetical protein
MRAKSFIFKSLFVSSFFLFTLMCFPSVSNAQSNDQGVEEDTYLEAQSNAPVAQGFLQTLANLMVKRNEAMIMGTIEEVDLEKKTLKILGQTVFFTSETTLLGGTRGLPGLKAKQIIILTVQQKDSKLIAVEIFKMPKSSRKPL